MLPPVNHMSQTVILELVRRWLRQLCDDDCSKSVLQSLYDPQEGVTEDSIDWIEICTGFSQAAQRLQRFSITVSNCSYYCGENREALIVFFLFKTVMRRLTSRTNMLVEDKSWCVVYREKKSPICSYWYILYSKSCRYVHSETVNVTFQKMHERQKVDKNLGRNKSFLYSFSCGQYVKAIP